MYSSPYTNIAFISYKREDEKWAKWLQNKLQHYKLPTEICRQNPNMEFAKPPRHVFKDTTDLSGGVLAKSIKEGLDSSKFLIVICSPRAAKSEWVCKEVQAFIDSGREEYIIPFIIDGEPYAKNPENECFPEALKTLAGDRELLGININENGRDYAAVKVVSRLFNLKFDTLWNRFLREKRRNLLIKVLTFVLILIIGTGAVAYSSHQKLLAETANKEKELQHLYTNYLECQKLMEESQYSTAFNKVKSILKDNGDILPDSLHDKYEFILRKAYQNLNSELPTLTQTTRAEFPEMEQGAMPVLFSNQENAIYVGCGGLSKINITTGKKQGFNEEWPAEIRINNDKVIGFDDFNVTFYDKSSLDKLGEFSLRDNNTNSYPTYISSSYDGSRCLMYNTESKAFAVWDVQNHSVIRSFLSESGCGSISGDGQVLVLVEDKEFKLYDIDTGNIIPWNGNCNAHKLQFDQSGNWLLLYLKETENVRILNLETKEDYLLDVDIPEEEWGSSFNSCGDIYSNKYIVSEDGKYVAIAGKIYDMPKGNLFFELKNPDLAQGIMITNDAKQIVQVNVDKSIYTYTRKGKNLFETCQIDYEKYRDEYQMPKGITGNGDSDIIFYDNNKFIGKINNLFTDIYMICVTDDKKYALISALNKPTTLYCIKTGLPIEEYPHNSEGWDSSFIGPDGCFYFPTLSTVYKYRFIPLKELLEIDIEE